MKSLNTAKAMNTYCSECGALPGDPCLYLPMPAPDRYVRSAAQRELLARVGTPTRRPHNARYRCEKQRLGEWLCKYGRLLTDLDQG